MIRHVLILGGTGFIGSAFYEKIARNTGQNDHIHLVVRDESKVEKGENITVYSGDLQTFDWHSLTHFPDVIYHFARIHSTRWKNWGRKRAARQGKSANMRLLNFLSAQERSVHLIYLSGSLMYGNHASTVLENEPLNPISFARQYVEAEMPFVDFQRNQTNSMMEITLVRVPWVLGQGSWFSGFYLTKMKQKKSVPVYGKGENRMSFISLVDLCSCLERIPFLPVQPTINLAYPHTLSQTEFAKIIGEQSGLPIVREELRNHEVAVQEAFTSNIQLGSKYQDFDDILKRESVREIMRSTVQSILGKKL